MEAVALSHGPSHCPDRVGGREAHSSNALGRGSRRAAGAGSPTPTTLVRAHTASAAMTLSAGVAKAASWLTCGAQDTGGPDLHSPFPQAWVWGPSAQHVPLGRPWTAFPGSGLALGAAGCPLWSAAWVTLPWVPENCMSLVTCSGPE